MSEKTYLMEVLNRIGSKKWSRTYFQCYSYNLVTSNELWIQ